jgi:hypothetical protein
VSEAARQQKPNHVDGRDKPGHYGKRGQSLCALNGLGIAFDDDEIRAR